MPPNTYQQKTEKFFLNIGKRNLTSPKRLFLLKIVPWTPRMQSWQRRRTIVIKGTKKFTPGRKGIVNSTFLKKYFFIKMFQWTLRMQWWQKHQKQFDKTKKYFCWSSGIDQKKSFFNEKKVFPQTFLRDTWSAVLTTPPLSYRWNAENISLKICKQKIWVPRKSCFPSIFSQWHDECSQCTASKKISAKDRKHFTPCPKTINNKFFLKKLFSNKLFLWTFRMECGQTHWKISDKNEKVFRSIFENDLKKKHIFFLEKTFLLKVFVWSLKIQFWALRRKLVNRKPKLCRSKFEIDKKKHFFNDLFSEYVSMDNNAVLTTAPENYQQKAENILLNEQKRSKIHISERQFFPSRCFYKHLECSVDKRAEIFLTKRNIFA